MQEERALVYRERVKLVPTAYSTIVKCRQVTQEFHYAVPKTIKFACNSFDKAGQSTSPTLKLRFYGPSRLFHSLQA